jgi:hypothetical protein
MNDLIKDLATKAIVENITSDRWVFNDAELEKFAELLIRECAETIQDFVDHRFPASEYPVRLKRYFGIK